MCSWFRRRNKRNTVAKEPTPTFSPLAQQNQAGDVPYLLPKNAREDQRLDYQHHVLYKTLSNHYLAPLSPTTATILDVGTGTGIWPAAMATCFPQAHILGVDMTLSSLPDPLPAGCLFAQANVLKGLPFPDKQFDFTHQRLLFAGIPANDWPAAVHELVRVTRPGGWVELLEIGATFQQAGPATHALLTWMTDISRGLGFDVRILSRLSEFLRNAGCDPVEAQEIPIPLGDWAGRAGQTLKADVVSAYLALKDPYCARSKTPPSTFDAMLQAAIAEWEQNHTSYVFHAIYGRRRP